MSDDTTIDQKIADRKQVINDQLNVLKAEQDKIIEGFTTGKTRLGEIGIEMLKLGGAIEELEALIK